MKENPCLLSSLSAFKTGADLWVVSDPNSSPYHSKIDWYLSFMMKKNRAKKISICPLPPHLQKHFKPFFKWEPKSPSPLLMQTAFRLPNLWTVELICTHKGLWLNQAYTIWEKLNRPTLRLFVPRLVTKEDVETTWRKAYVPVQYLL